MDLTSCTFWLRMWSIYSLMPGLLLLNKERSTWPCPKGSFCRWEAGHRDCWCGIRRGRFSYWDCGHDFACTRGGFRGRFRWGVGLSDSFKLIRIIYHSQIQTKVPPLTCSFSIRTNFDSYLHFIIFWCKTTNIVKYSNRQHWHQSKSE